MICGCEVTTACACCVTACMGAVCMMMGCWVAPDICNLIICSCCGVNWIWRGTSVHIRQGVGGNVRQSVQSRVYKQNSMYFNILYGLVKVYHSSNTNSIEHQLN